MPRQIDADWRGRGCGIGGAGGLHLAICVCRVSAHPCPGSAVLLIPDCLFVRLRYCWILIWGLTCAKSPTREETVVQQETWICSLMAGPGQAPPWQKVSHSLLQVLPRPMAGAPLPPGSFCLLGLWL